MQKAALPILIATLALAAAGCTRQKTKRQAPKILVPIERTEEGKSEDYDYYQPDKNGNYPAPPPPPSSSEPTPEVPGEAPYPVPGGNHPPIEPIPADESYGDQQGGIPGGYPDGNPGGNPGDYPGGNGGHGPISEDSPGLDPYRTGYSYDSDLYYVGEGPDDLIPYLRKKMESVSQVYQDRNQAFADQILKVEYRMLDRRVDVDLELRLSQQQIQRVALTGELNENGYARIDVTGPGIGEPLTGELRCVENSGGCRTGFLRLEKGVANELHISNIVLRDLDLGIYTEFPEERAESNSSYYKQFRDYLIRAQQGSESNAKFSKSRYRSFVVVKGRSGFHLEMHTLDKKIVEFEGPLLASRSQGLQQKLVLSKSYPQDYGYDLSEALNRAELISCSGVGELGIRLTARSDSRGEEEQFELRFTRKVSRLITIGDGSLYFD